MSEDAWAAAARVVDPELAPLTLADLGILRRVDHVDGRVVVTLAPTYLGCPAMPEIAADVQRALSVAGYADAQVRTSLSPPWTSDWITPAGRRKLIENGIAPPAPSRAREPVVVQLGRTPQAVDCPHCGSRETVEHSTYGVTPCRALWRCVDCSEPFEYLKPL